MAILQRELFSKGTHYCVVIKQIAQRVVIKEVIDGDHIDALYTKPTGLRSAPSGTAAMAHLAAEFDQKLLGNGHCTRSITLDCTYETICERCGFFETGPDFAPILLRQRDHANQHHQPDRAELFTTLLDGIDTDPPNMVT